MTEPSISKLTDQNDAWLMSLLQRAYYCLYDDLLPLLDEPDEAWGIDSLLSEIEDTGVLEMTFMEVEEIEDAGS